MAGSPLLHVRPIVICALAIAEALVLGGFALVLPWTVDGLIHGVVAVLCLGYLATAALCFSHKLGFARIARATAWCTLGAFVALCLQLVFWSAHLVSLYSEIGWALTGGLFVFLCALGLFMVPFPICVLLSVPKNAATASGAPRSKTSATAAGATLFLAFTAGAAGHDLLRTAPAAASTQSSASVRAIAQSLKNGQKLRPVSGLYLSAPLSCKNGKIDGAWAITFFDGKKVRFACIEGDQAQKESQAKAILAGNRGQTLKVDILRVRNHIAAENSLLSALSLRPGLDGLCAHDSCYLPWQMTAAEGYSAYRPLEAIKEARFGVDLEALATALGGKPGDDVQVLTTESLLLKVDRAGQLKEQRLTRMGPGPTLLSAEALSRGQQLARSYIDRAQNKQGVFRYSLNPYSGAENADQVNVPRHAGTTLVLCEQPEPSRKLKRTIRRATGFLLSLYHDQKTWGFFRKGKGNPGLGETALPTIALLECARRGRIDLPTMWPQLAEFLVGQQRPNGSFHPSFDLKGSRPTGDGEILFAAGQAVYAMVLIDEILHKQGSKAPESVALEAKVHQALRSAMNYYSGPYWDRAPRSFFFIEENWHCLAARAALLHHRHAAYEQFCLDYVSFKQRFIQTQDTLGFRGGLTLSPMFAPHATATSGFAEATAAALSLAKAQGRHFPDLERSLKLSIEYLLQIQLQPETCFACINDKAFGGYTESPVSGDIRIDFVQHALAAMTHAGEVLSIDHAAPTGNISP